MAPLWLVFFSMLQRNETYRPFTPLLLVLLAVTLWFTAICCIANHEALLSFRAVQIIVAAAAALGAGQRLVLR
jgi:hypothetical protein